MCSRARVSIRAGTLIVSKGNCLAIGTPDEVERFAGELVRAARKARAQEPRKPRPAPIEHLDI